MRWVVRVRLLVLGLAACVPSRSTTPLPELVPEERDPTWSDQTVALRTQLGRAGISLELGGARGSLETQACATGHAGCTRCELLAESDGVSESALAELVAAFGRYPVALLDAAKIERVALCRELTSDDESPAGLADIEGRTLFVNLESLLRHDGSGYSIDYIAETAHHEVYHLFDLPAGPRPFDLEWDELNPHAFTYGKRHRDARPFGFVNAYAATNAVEDRASTFQFLMARSDELCGLAKDDPTLFAKAAIVWRRIAKASGAGVMGGAASCFADLLAAR